MPAKIATVPVKTAAFILGLNPRAADYLAVMGKLPLVPMGGPKRVAVATLEAMIGRVIDAAEITDAQAQHKNWLVAHRTKIQKERDARKVLAKQHGQST